MPASRLAPKPMAKASGASKPVAKQALAEARLRDMAAAAPDPVARRQELLLDQWQGAARRTQLIDWSAPVDYTVDLTKVNKPAGSWSTARDLTPLRDTVRHTAGRPGEISHTQRVQHQKAVDAAAKHHGKNRKEAPQAPKEPRFNGFL